MLKAIPTKHGKFLESEGFSQPKEVEYVAQVRQADADAQVAELEGQISQLQDELDRFNEQCQISNASDFSLNGGGVARGAITA